MSEVLEAEVNKPDAVRELELFCELRKLKTFLKPIAKNGRCHIGKGGGYDYFHIDDILETIDTVINEHGLNVAIWQEIKYEMVSQTKIDYIETVFIHTKNGYKHIIKTDLNMGETIELYKLDMQYRSEYANLTKTERRQANNTIQQIMGSSFTYFCRYALVKFFGITGLLEDQDGNVDADTTRRYQTKYLNGSSHVGVETGKEGLYQALQTISNQEIARKIKSYVEYGLLTLKAGWYFCLGFKNNIKGKIDEFEIKDKQLQAKIQRKESNNTGKHNPATTKETQDRRVMESTPLPAQYKNDHALLKEQYREGKLDYKTFWKYYFAIQKQDKYVLSKYQAWKDKMGADAWSSWDEDHDSMRMNHNSLNYDDIPFDDVPFDNNPMGVYEGALQ
ncbi:ERF family protein [Borrelia sp. P9F1]|uniref:ERF family protein n=1 Tax=Borrelia sp. P9F1 TaxID=3058374 RepID=UPI00264901D6|nr:ERF family protein [Borrelia sp. P9F1]WKC58476.1 ERF family protein [Borrelia sp. P9F1]